MAILQFEPSKECMFLRVKMARDVQERVERYRAFFGALELADLAERSFVYVTDKDADGRAQEKQRHLPSGGRAVVVCEVGFPRR